MLERIRKQKMAIAAYGSEYLLPASLTNHQLDLINKIVEELTQSLNKCCIHLINYTFHQNFSKEFRKS